MSKQDSSAPAAKGGVAVLCFLAIIVGQIYLLRNLIFSGDPVIFTAPYLLELLFCLLLLAGIVICWIRPQGWGGLIGRSIALGLFALYALVTILNYPVFSTAYLTGFQAQFASAGGGFVGLKLVLALVGVIAAIPVAPRIDDREYARRLREKVQRQEAEWAKASLKGAQEDLNATLAKLRETLSEEEMAALLTQLQQTAQQQSPPSSGQPASEAPPSGDASGDSTQPASEYWRGWGCG